MPSAEELRRRRPPRAGRPLADLDHEVGIKVGSRSLQRLTRSPDAERSSLQGIRVGIFPEADARAEECDPSVPCRAEVLDHGLRAVEIGHPDVVDTCCGNLLPE